MKRLPWISNITFFILLSVSGCFWALQLFKPAARKMTVPIPVAMLAQAGTVASLFGETASQVVSNYQLKGVVLANPNDQSVAIVSFNGNPAEAYLIHTEIQPNVILSEVYASHIMLQDHGVNKRVDLPKDAIVINDEPISAIAPRISRGYSDRPHAESRAAGVVSRRGREPESELHNSDLPNVEPHVMSEEERTLLQKSLNH